MSGRQANAVRVVTDIDDTVKSSGGVKLFGIALGGIDVRLEYNIHINLLTQLNIHINMFSLNRHNMNVVISILVLFNLHLNYQNIVYPSLLSYLY